MLAEYVTNRVRYEKYVESAYQRTITYKVRCFQLIEMLNLQSTDIDMNIRARPKSYERTNEQYGITQRSHPVKPINH